MEWLQVVNDACLAEDPVEILVCSSASPINGEEDVGFIEEANV